MTLRSIDGGASFEPVLESFSMVPPVFDADGVA